MPFFTDQTGRTVTILSATRIISLVPSQTELLFDLGLDQEVVGITKFCIHPKEWFQTKTRVGGTKEIKMDIIRQLKPDLVIANKEENVKEQVEELACHYPVWVSDVNSLDDALAMIGQIGLITQKGKAAQQIALSINEKFSSLPEVNKKLRVAYLIWKDPYMAAGADTFIHAMLEKAGFENVFRDRPRYPIVSLEELRTKNIEVIMLSSEPYHFKEVLQEELKTLLQTKVVHVDGEMFSWYGSRLLKAPEYFMKVRGMIGTSDS